MSDFAPTPQHGAAYAVVIERVGGIDAIGGCATVDQFLAIQTTLHEIRAWAATQSKDVREAYVYGIDKVLADATARLGIHQNASKVRAALLTIPRPESGPVKPDL